MRAAFYIKTGPAREVLQYGEQPTPHAAPGEVRLRLHASGVNPADANRRAGRTPGDFPLIIANSDGAGVIDEVGDGVDTAWLGKRVWLHNGQRGRPFGTAAEYIALDHRLIAPLPDGTSFAAGATLGIPGMTAHRCLFADGDVKGLDVLVTGGAGAVGHYAIQLAKWAGARVLTTVSSAAKAEHARKAGADVVIDYRAEDVAARVVAETGGKGVERLVEVDFGGNLAVTLKVMAVNGTVAMYASRGEATPVVPIYDFMRRNVNVRTVFLATAPLPARQQAQRDLVALCNA
ncbi:MAG: NADPH:quinone reductase, partial [Reyranellales bacterium]